MVPHDFGFNTWEGYQAMVVTEQKGFFAKSVHVHQLMDCVEQHTERMSSIMLWFKHLSEAKFVVAVGALGWMLAVGMGLSILYNYENAPGMMKPAPRQWPISSKIQREPGRAALVMLAHPHCSCTRASIGELALIMARAQDSMKAYVLFIKPAGFSADWVKTDLWNTAKAIPGVTVIEDSEGKEARMFHAETSGQALLYDDTGRLLFSGGITGSRGHYGDNAGRSAIVSLLSKGIADRNETFVFGCSLFGSHSKNDSGR